MKYSKKSFNSNKPTLLEDYNSRQDSVNRQESSDVKKCFTNQAHQTIIASAGILGVVFSIMGNDINWSILAITTMLIIATCLMTINVGTNKFNTSNRTLAYQIHLSRITDYEESNSEDESLLSNELKRIDWEEAMFAWRVVQPIIYNFFYGIGRRHRTKYREQVEEEVRKYPWYDTKKLISVSAKEQGFSIKGSFYPGTYLRKMFFQLYFVMAILLMFYGISIFQLLNKRGNSTTEIILILIIAAVPIFYIVASIINSYFKCKKLESGLVSIQTNAFVWRIVSITLLLAKQKAIEKNRNVKDSNYCQIYKGYTVEIAQIASDDLYYNLHKIHEWLAEKENLLINAFKE